MNGYDWQFNWFTSILFFFEKFRSLAIRLTNELYRFEMFEIKNISVGPNWIGKCAKRYIEEIWSIAQAMYMKIDSIPTLLSYVININVSMHDEMTLKFISFLSVSIVRCTSFWKYLRSQKQNDFRAQYDFGSNRKISRKKNDL